MADEVSDLMLFVKIVQAGNLSAAARTLNASPAAMSRALSALESRLGVRLVTRTSRSFQLTEEGNQFYERCQKIVADIAVAEAEVSAKTGSVRGTLHVGAPSEIGRRLIAPLIGQFASKFPEVEVRLVLSDAGLDVIDDGLDVALRIGLPNDNTGQADRMCVTSLFQKAWCASASRRAEGAQLHPTHAWQAPHGFVGFPAGRSTFRNKGGWLSYHFQRRSGTRLGSRRQRYSSQSELGLGARA